MMKIKILPVVSLAFILLFCAAQPGITEAATLIGPSGSSADDQKKADQNLQKATDDYKTSLQKMAAIYDQNVKTASDQHRSVSQQRGRMQISRGVHRACLGPLSGCRIKYLGAGNVLKAASHQNQSAGQKRGGVRFAGFVQIASACPAATGRVVNFGARKELIGALTACHHYAAILQQSCGVKFAAAGQRATAAR